MNVEKITISDYPTHIDFKKLTANFKKIWAPLNTEQIFLVPAEKYPNKIMISELSERYFSSWNKIGRILEKIDEEPLKYLTVAEIRNLEKEAEQAEITLAQLIEYYTLIEGKEFLDYQKALSLASKIKETARKAREDIVLARVRKRAEERIKTDKNVSDPLKNFEIGSSYSFLPIQNGPKKGYVRITHKNGGEELLSKCKTNVLKKLLEYNYREIAIEEVVSACDIHSKIPEKTVIRYINEINTVLRRIHGQENSRYQYVTYKDNKIYPRIT